MNFPGIGRQTWQMRLAIFPLLALAAHLAVWAQTEPSANSSAVVGRVLDAQSQPIADTTVLLTGKDGVPVLSHRTDAKGTYRFSGLAEGSYALRAEKSNLGEAVSARFVLGPKDTKKIDLTITPAKSSSVPPPKPGREEPQFFDEPQFTVAGVTDPANAGGHGSDAILRTTEALTKQTVLLSGESRARPEPDIAASNARAETSLRETVEQAPGNFDANRRLGSLLLEDGKAGQALPYLEQASRIQPDDYETSRELALAYADAGEYQHARKNLQMLLARKERAELDHLLADIDEKQGNPLAAVEEYQRAAVLDPSESNLFDWGAELLLHHAAEPAIEVFTKGNRLFPNSARMLVGLGVTWYSRGSYQQAARELCRASDMSPDDETAYLFLGKMQNAEINRSEETANRLARFVRLQPENPQANYYYAMSLWKKRTGAEDVENSAQVESFLNKAVQLDPNLALAYLQLGIVYSEGKDLPKAILAYQRAIQADPRLAEGHYRLAQAYKRTGENSKSQSELQLYEQISRETAAQVERERSEIRQFVYTLKDQATAPRNPAVR
jgi:tetratricopeptide (TPR) repeat protein